MAKLAIKKAPAPHGEIVSIPSFVFPIGQARDKEMFDAAKRPQPKQTFEAPADTSPSVQLLNAVAPRNPAEAYSYGRRSYPSFEAAKAANPGMALISRPTDGRDAGERASRFGKAMGYSKQAHDAFAALAKLGGGPAAERPFAPLGRAIDMAGAGATFLASRQRGEPVDVGIMRAVAPIAGGAIGGTGGAAAGAAGMGFLGSIVPVAGTASGVALGGIAGGSAGAYMGGEAGEDIADIYARGRKYRW